MKKILIILMVFISCKSTETGKNRESRSHDAKEQLSRSWSIVSLNGEDLTAHKFSRKQPELSLDLANNKLGGFGGCNVLSGSVSFNENQLKFGVIASSRMICPDIKIEQQLVKQLSDKSYQYEINGSRLILTGISGSKIILEGN